MTARNHPSDWKLQTICQADIEDFDETYKIIPRTNEEFRVSRDGVVLSRKRKSLPAGWWVILKQTKSRVAHPFNRVCIIQAGGEKRTRQVSSLILEAFVCDKPSPLHIAAHKNGVSDDDRLDNLVWALMRDVKHAGIVRGTYAHGERAGNCKHDLEQVQAARKVVLEYQVPIALLATVLGFNETRMREWIIGESWNEGKWDDLVCPLTGTLKTTPSLAPDPAVP
jgi:hypothetical protein